MKRPWMTFLLLGILLLVPALAAAQGILVVVDPDQIVRLPRPAHVVIWPPHPPHPHPPMPPRPPRPASTYKIESLDIQARVIEQVAEVQVSQTFVNTGSRQMEVAFVFPLPYDGAIDEMTLLVDGREYPAQLLDADEARSTYEGIVRKNQDPALLEWIGTGMFKTSVFPVPAGASRTVTLNYSQMLRMSNGVTDFLFPMSTAKYTSDPIEEINMRVIIESGRDIKNVYSPSHEVKVRRPNDKKAVISWNAEDTVPGEDFRLLYDIGEGKVGASVLSYRPEGGEDGYFLLLASPRVRADNEEPPKKTVVFVLDRSGSMSGKKIEQARDSLSFVLNNLREGDTFNIIAYDSRVEMFKPELQRYNEETREDALDFCENIYSGGSTNIDLALKTALDQLEDDERPSYVIFLTDGLPTTGETNEAKIVDNATEANDAGARLFTFGVGYDVNSRLLDRLARVSYGQSDYVRPDDDIEEQVGRLYQRIESPVLTDVEVTFDFEEGGRRRDVSRIYPTGRLDLFAGEQLILAGRYKAEGAARVTLRGEVNGESKRYRFDVEFNEAGPDEKFAFVEKLWALRRIGEILDELDLNGENEELVDELVELSKRHGILTPYTSFLADENTNLHDMASNARRAGIALESLGEAEGYGGFAQREFKGQLQRAENSSLAAAPSASADAARMAYSLGMPSTPGMSGSGNGRGGMGSMGGGFSSGRDQFGATRPRATAEAADSEEANEFGARVASAVRQIGNRAFYQREGQWVDSTVTEEQETNAVRIQQFSDEYFELAATNGRELAQYMVFDEPVLVNFDSQAYLIEP
jgi:Ca-activated chloride channel homolog